jgi:hypothetical protein
MSEGAAAHKPGCSFSESGSCTCDTVVPIGGWLALVVIQIVLGPLRLTLDLAKNYLPLFTPRPLALMADTRRPSYDPLLLPAVSFEAITKFVLLVGCLYVGWLFFTRSRRTPRAYVVLMAVWTAYNWLDLLLQTQLTAQSAHATLPETVGRATAATLAAFVWSAYFLRSERVRRTFVQP